MRRGQLTVFVLLGLVMLLIISFIVYAATQAVEDERDRREDDLADDQSAINQINQYVRSCVEDNIQNATQQVFLQGGVLYQDQDGRASRDSTTTYSPFAGPKTYDVKHGVIDDYPCSSVTDQPPDYPVPNTTFNKYDEYSCWESTPRYGYLETDSSAGYLGVTTYPRSCTDTSDNRLDNADSPFVGVRCGQHLAAKENNALETHLEDAATNVVSNCAGNNTLINNTGHTISLNGTPNVSVGYETESTNFRVNLPLKIRVDGGEPTLQRSNFTYRADLPLLSTWSTLYEALREDVREPRFNLSEELASYNTEMTRKNGDRVYEIRDNSVTWNGEPLTIVTVVEDRSPVLNFINNYPRHDYLHGVVEATNDFSIAPDAVDPDDHQPPNITYEGFGADHTAGDPSNPNRMDPQDDVRGAPKSTQSLSSGNTLQARNGSHTVKDRYSWGLYQTKVNAYENGSLGDYQVLNILVIDKPRLLFNATDPHDNHRISIEDPFTLNGSSSQPPKAFGQEPLYDVAWQLPNRTVPRPTMNGITTDDLGTYTIENITALHKNHGLTVGTSNVSLTATANTTYKDNVQNTVENEVTVVDCISNENWSGNPYPHNDGANPYTVQHPCCEPTGPTNTVVNEGSKVCYEQDVFGSKSELQSELNDFESDVNTYTEVPITQSEINNAANAISNMNSSENETLRLKRHCGGERGNTCGGDITITVD